MINERPDTRYFFDSTTYWSEGDERADFEGMQPIHCVKSIFGRGTRVFLDIAGNELTDSDHRELTALYRRFGGDLNQRASLEADKAASFPAPTRQTMDMAR